MSYKVESINWIEFGPCRWDYMEHTTVEAKGLTLEDALGYAHYLNDATCDQDSIMFDNERECGSYKETVSGGATGYRFIVMKE